MGGARTGQQHTLWCEVCCGVRCVSRSLEGLMIGNEAAPTKRVVAVNGNKKIGGACCAAAPELACPHLCNSHLPLPPRPRSRDLLFVSRSRRPQQGALEAKYGRIISGPSPRASSPSPAAACVSPATFFPVLAPLLRCVRESKVTHSADMRLFWTGTRVGGQLSD